MKNTIPHKRSDLEKELNSAVAEKKLTRKNILAKTLPLAISLAITTQACSSFQLTPTKTHNITNKKQYQQIEENLEPSDKIIYEQIEINTKNKEQQEKIINSLDTLKKTQPTKYDILKRGCAEITPKRNFLERLIDQTTNKIDIPEETFKKEKIPLVELLTEYRVTNLNEYKKIEKEYTKNREDKTLYIDGIKLNITKEKHIPRYIRAMDLIEKADKIEYEMIKEATKEILDQDTYKGHKHFKRYWDGCSALARPTYGLIVLDRDLRTSNVYLARILLHEATHLILGHCLTKEDEYGNKGRFVGSTPLSNRYFERHKETLEKKGIRRKENQLDDPDYHHKIIYPCNYTVLKKIKRVSKKSDQVRQDD